MTDLVDTTEMYLRTILDLEEERIVPLRARISERLGHSGPTVSQTIARMVRDGLVTVSEDRHLVLTGEGRTRAVQVLRKHRLAERLLHDIIGLDWEYVHDEACRWEHVMSQNVEDRIVSLLDAPDFSPYGTPIPQPDATEHDLAESFLTGVRSLADVTRDAETPHVGVVRRLGEPVQVDPGLLARLREAGVLPGSVGTFIRDGDEIDAQMEGGSAAGVRIAMDVAHHIYVAEKS